jgi:hypothetical protein
MIINDKSKNLESSGLQQQRAFMIKASGQAFRAISDSLYSDKPGSIVRELYSNAYDSHVLAGKRDIPAEIHLPTTFDPRFYVRDYGVGLSHEEILNLYSTYFDSTKRASNDQIGGFGLGSKTPFAYADQFIVTSWHGGYKRVYSAFISEDETPQIALLTDTLSNEPNGLQVEFGVKPADAHRFQEAARNQLRYFNPTPKFLGNVDITFAPRAPFMKGKDWEFFTASTVSHSAARIVVVGQVGYPVPDNNEGFNAALSPQARAFMSRSWIIHVPVGAVDVTVSRESIQMNKKTITYLAKKLDDVITELSVQVAAKLKKQPTKYLTYQWGKTYVSSFIGYRSWSPDAFAKAMMAATGVTDNDLVYKLDKDEEFEISPVSSYSLNADGGHLRSAKPIQYKGKGSVVNPNITI